ncbi:MAG: asparagine--tRNA ligase, partial [Ignavibacteriales bacterium]|nr:asparagine--tRNA ligase [Ignavibacteriales bacterium]
MKRVYIDELNKHAGEEVQLRGWLYHKRSSGKIRFLLLRDGTGVVQGVMMKGGIADDVFAKFDELTQESSFALTGKVRKDDRAPGGFELEISGIEIYSIASEYP